jgi:hypothetical protein
MFGIENFESKETEMKKKLLLMGLVSVLLMAGMMFTACGGDDDDGGGISAPKPGDLPDLPTDTGATLAYVDNEAEAKALLSSEFFRYVLWSADEAADDLIDAKAAEDENSRSWEVGPDDKTKTGFIINSKGKQTSKGFDLSGFFSGGPKPNVGDSSEMSSSEETTIEFIANNTTGPVTIYSGSHLASKRDGSQSMKVKAIDETSGTITLTVSGSGSSSYAYGLTVSSNGKGAKIILEAKITWKDNNVEITLPPGNEFDSTTYSGFLRVYGAENKIVYEKAIDSEKAFNDEVREYFGIN